MSRFKGYDIGLDGGFKLDLTSFLPSEGHLCFKFEQLVNNLDLSDIESTYSDRGRSAMHPKMLLCIIFFGYAVGIRSGRKLEKACCEDLIFIYLSKGLHPGKSSINDFRKLHYEKFESLFLQVIQMCQHSGYGDNSMCIVDGSKILANSSKKRTKNQLELDKCYKNLQEDISLLENELRRSATEESEATIKKNAS